jgi:hypothetical protein
MITEDRVNQICAGLRNVMRDIETRHEAQGITISGPMKAFIGSNFLLGAAYVATWLGEAKLARAITDAGLQGTMIGLALCKDKGDDNDQS